LYKSLLAGGLSDAEARGTAWPEEPANGARMLPDHDQRGDSPGHARIAGPDTPSDAQRLAALLAQADDECDRSTETRQQAEQRAERLFLASRIPL
jgi:hypothetical protein